MFYSDLRKYLKYFVFVFLIVFLVINWDNMSWLFNYQVVSGFVTDFFQKPKEVLDDNAVQESNVKIKDFEYTDKANGIEIPKIGISAPLVITDSTNITDMRAALDKGVVYYPGTALPGEAGQTHIVGHSAPAGWPKIKHDWVFSKLNDLVEGDEVFIYFNQKKFTYHVTQKIFIERGEEIPQDDLTKNESVLILISCWPPGKNLRRIAVEAI